VIVKDIKKNPLIILIKIKKIMSKNEPDLWLLASTAMALEKLGAGENVLHRLLEAKKESDRKNYPAKHAILRKLLGTYPKDFKIDSSDHFAHGLTHKPTNFRIHIPKTVMPYMSNKDT
jgi:hypothetical protein